MYGAWELYDMLAVLCHCYYCCHLVEAQQVEQVEQVDRKDRDLCQQKDGASFISTQRHYDMFPHQRRGAFQVASIQHRGIVCIVALAHQCIGTWRHGDLAGGLIGGLRLEEGLSWLVGGVAANLA